MSELHKYILSIFRIMTSLIAVFPRDFLRRMGNLIGLGCYFLLPERRKIAIKNLSLAYGNEKSSDEIKKITQQIFKNLCQIVFEVAWSKPIGLEELTDLIETKGINHLHSAFGKGRGLLIMTAHIGNWELLPAVFVREKVPLNVVYRPLDFPPLNAFIDEYRTRFGLKTVSKSRSIRKLLNALKDGEAVGLLMDQNVRKRLGVSTVFFGRPVQMNKGLALLALKTGAPVLPAFLIRQGTQFKAEILPEIPLIRTGDKEKDIAVNSQQYNSVIEGYIRRYPEQWLWLHKRWKIR